MKHERITGNERSDATERAERSAGRARAKLALVPPIVAPVEVERGAVPSDSRATFESAALTVLHECQRFTFYR